LHAEEPVGGWQRDLVDESLRRCNRTPVEGSDPAREPIGKTNRPAPRPEGPVEVAVSLRGVTVEVVRAENDFERATTADQMW
jgi:hypothetical protein